MLHIQSQGHEIAGHTVDHQNLNGVNPDGTPLTDPQRRYQICKDYEDLQNDGLNVTNFAYPFGGDFLGSPRMVYECGYRSARDSGGLRQVDSCLPCPSAIQLPIQNKYLYRIPSIVVTANMSADELLGYVDAASKYTVYDDKWLIFTFHDVVEEIVSIKNILFPTFIELLNGLKVRVDNPSAATFVKSVREILEIFPTSYVPTGPDTTTPSTPDVGTPAPSTSSVTTVPAPSSTPVPVCGSAITISLLATIFATTLLL